MDELRHLWCTHCNQSVCGLRSEDGFEQDGELGDDETLDCIVCADLQTAIGKFTDCLLAMP